MGQVGPGRLAFVDLAQDKATPPSVETIAGGAKSLPREGSNKIPNTGWSGRAAKGSPGDLAQIPSEKVGMRFWLQPPKPAGSKRPQHTLKPASVNRRAWNASPSCEVVYRYLRSGALGCCQPGA